MALPGGGLRLDKVDYRTILEEEAARNGIRVFYHKKHPQWGRAALRSRRIFVPEPVEFTSFFTALHEMGHIMSGHLGGDGKPEYIWEFEAFGWAFRFCKSRGIEVPQATTNDERDIIAEKLRDEVKSGARRLDVSVVKFVKEGDDDDPDVEYIKKFVSDDGSVQTPRR